ncbi:MAG: hypothetical protein IIY21_29260 [Clostridiales bacterium]|nr:hypothetical protein [Clostridiales bacterium]MBQ5823975.1 hypothetical protein [Clostridia bacterium]
MELEELIAKISSGECLTDNIEDNFDLGLALAYLEELRQWREDPFSMMKKTCESMRSCINCGWHYIGCAECLSNTPEEWKL